jgi:23S rRNA-/tRNA-specific pseudouridylate synthase
MRVPPVLTPEDAEYVRSMVIEQDASILALNKPSGLSSQGGRGQHKTLDDFLSIFARPNGKRPDLVHRLDRDTSGVILAAKIKPAASFLGKAMMGRKFKKIYIALVASAPEPRDGIINVPLRRDELGREAYMRVCVPDHPDAESARRAIARWSLETALLSLNCVPKLDACTSCVCTLHTSAGPSLATPAMAEL